ncbi:cytoskeleton-associated protein 2 [Mixophyes fleayi]|uniref:cytoskeleton-associated protein 2 n=1 Tax=Mixophyes fleayi TaxID=3061075 RepID=UPI003F4DD26F
MGSVPVTALPASRRLQPGYREQRRKKVEEYLSQKMSKKPIVPGKQPEIRSPLMERSNRALEKKSEQINNLERKPVKPFNKENIGVDAKKVGKNVTLSRSVLKTKSVTEKQQKDENVKLESAKEKPKLSAKPVLGAYRGKIVQSKIQSFRNTTEGTSGKRQTVESKRITEGTSGKSQTVESKRIMQKSVENRPKTSTVARKPPAKPSSASDVKQKKPLVPPVSLQSRASTSLVIKSKSEPVTVRRQTQVTDQKKSIGGNVLQRPQPIKSILKNGPARSDPETKSNKSVTTHPVNAMKNHRQTMPAQQRSTASRYSRPNESADEQKARLAEWRASKGKVMKRPPICVVIPSTYKVQKAGPETNSETKTEPEVPRQLFWATMAEEDEQEVFTLRVHQIFGDCQKLIDEGCPKEEVLSILETQIQNVPEARKLSGYWECLARLEQRDGQLDKVIAICEEAVAAGAQPLEELRRILADSLEKLKASSEENMKKESEQVVPPEEYKVEIQSEPTDTVDEKKKRSRRRAVRLELKNPSTPEKPSKSQQTPENGDIVSSVVRFNIRTTPHLEKMKKLQMNEGESSIKNYKFLTPVRRSCRLERKSHTFPDMLKDHDPCITGISQLEDLEDPVSCTNAYIFRKNDALQEITAKSATKKNKRPAQAID